MPTIRKIEAKPSILLTQSDGTIRKKRVAAYARVSTEQDEQQSSYETQVNFYTNYIQSNPEWEFAGIYSDEGISGTNTKHREGFRRMIDDALSGKIDLILTKSISRFARNTVDSLVTIRKLKENGVEVYFEKENIYSMDSKGELMLTIMSSIAQEESRSISENVTWGKRKSMADGKVYMAYRGFLGYERGEDGKPKINEEEAKIVRRIYSMFLKGMGYREIANALDREGIPTPMNGKCWRVRTIISILSNEKYKGDALLQKTYAVDWLNKKRGKNTGQLPQYYIEGSHPAIISPAVFDLVQNEIAKRKDQHKRNTGPFSNIIICGDCGAYYGRKVWHSKTKYKSSIWFCNSKYKGQHICKTPNIRDEQLKKAFVEAFNLLIQNKDLYVSKAQKRINSLIDTSVLEKKLESKEAEYDEAYKAIKDLVDSNSIRLQNQDEYTKKFNEAESRFQILEKEISELNTRIASIKAQREKIAIYLNTLKADNKIIEEFNEDLWYAFVDKVTVYTDNNLKFQFKDGSNMSISIDERAEK